MPSFNDSANWESLDLPRLTEWGMSVARLESDGGEGPVYVVLRLEHEGAEPYDVVLPPTAALEIAVQLVVSAYRADPSIVKAP